MHHGRIAYTMPLVLAALGCTNDGPTAVTRLDQVAGTWIATRSELTVATDPSQRRELIGEGWSFVVVIDAAGTYRWELAEPGAQPTELAGVVELVADTLKFHPAEVDDAPPIIRPAFVAGLRDAQLLLVTDITVETGDFGFETGEFDVPVHWELDLRKGA